MNSKHHLLLLCASLWLAACAGGGGAKPTPDEASTEIIDPAVLSLHQQSVDLMQQERYEEALVVLIRAFDPQKPRLGIYLNLGIAYQMTGKKEEARKTFEEVLQIDPRNAVAFNQLGVIHRQEGRFSDAHAAYRNALHSNPDYAEAHLNMGILCDLYQGDIKCAIEHFQTYQTLVNKKDETVTLWLANLKQRQ